MTNPKMIIPFCLNKTTYKRSNECSNVNSYIKNRIASIASCIILFIQHSNCYRSASFKKSSTNNDKRSPRKNIGVLKIDKAMLICPKAIIKEPKNKAFFLP